MPKRHEYRLSLECLQRCSSTADLDGFCLRAVQAADEVALATLMLEAYRNTIDYEQETEAEAREEVRRYLSATADSEPLLEHSVLLSKDSALACACLVKYWRRRGCPLIGYVITHPMFKRRGMAATALTESLKRLRAAGHSEVRAVITQGNAASERLFFRAGFIVVVHS